MSLSPSCGNPILSILSCDIPFLGGMSLGLLSESLALSCFLLHVSLFSNDFESSAARDLMSAKFN